MAYSITVQYLDGQSGQYARVKRRYDGYWWNNSTNAWVATAVAACNLALTEDGTIKGKYTASAASMTPMYGGLYAIYVYSSTGVLISISEDIYNPDLKTALQIVNQAQRELRFPLSADFTDAHGLLMMAWLNAVQDYLGESYGWPEFRLQGSFQTVDGEALYYIYPSNCAKIDKIHHVQYSTSNPLTMLSDEDFRAYKRSVTSEGEPQYCRVYGRAGKALILELCPIPDTTYLFDFEGFQSPAEVTVVGDVPLLDWQLLVRGLVFWARKDQGDDATLDLDIFKGKASTAMTNAEDNWQDINPI